VLEVLEVLGEEMPARCAPQRFNPSCFHSLSRGINRRRIPPPVENLWPNLIKLVREGGHSIGRNKRPAFSSLLFACSIHPLEESKRFLEAASAFPFIKKSPRGNQSPCIPGAEVFTPPPPSSRGEYQERFHSMP